MNKKLGLAVAGALVAFASTANAGISIPAGDWTVDIGGNVNAYYIHNNSSDSHVITGGIANTKGANGSGASSINTGLLPSWLTVGAKTRQNDLDIAWAISIQPGASTAGPVGAGGKNENRQAYLTVGDASWGSIKLGKDLGVFGSDAILNDITLLGVGSQGVVGQTGGTTTTLGGIGTGYIYADFLGQMNYTSPNWNGFQFTAGIVQPHSDGSTYTGQVNNQKSPAYEAKASYAFTADQVTGKVWAEVKGQKVYGVANVAGKSETAVVYGVGANVNAAGFGLTGYYYSGEGVGTTAFLLNAFDSAGNKRDSDGGYVQATYTLPVGTKLGVAYGISSLDATAVDGASTLVKDNERWTVGAYHPLTKSLNLVAEYNRIESTNHLDQSNKSDIVSLGGILFF
jgi:predicted porin